MAPNWLPKRSTSAATNGRRTTDVDLDSDAAAEADQLRPDVEAPQPKNGASRLAGFAADAGGDGSVSDRMRKKLGLEGNWLHYVVAMLALIFALLIVVIVLGVLLSGRRTFDESQICLEPACLESSALLRGSLNATVSPCENVWVFSCGTWLANNPIPPSRSSWGVFQLLRARALEQYRTIVNTLPQPQDSDQLPWKIQNYYDSCMDMENVNIDRARRLKDAIRSLGGWAVLRNWNSNSFDPNHVLKKLHAEFRVEPLFSIRVVPDDAQVGTNIIKILPSGLALPDRSFYDRTPDDPIVTAYRQFIQDTVKTLGAQGPDANQFALNMYHLEKRIAEFTPTKQDVENPIRTYNRISVRELKNLAGAVPWLEILREVFPDAGVHQETEVLVVSTKYFDDLSQMYFTNDKTALNNFLMWKLALKMVPYLSVEFRNVYELFRSDLTGAREPQQRWEICTELLSEVFGHALGAMYHKSMKNPAETMTAVEEIFEHLKTVLISDVDSNGRLDHNVKSRSIEKIRQMKLQVGYPPMMRDSQHLEAEYQKLIVQKNDLHQNVVYGAKYQREMDQEALVKPKEEDRWKNALLEEEPAYVYQANVVVVPSYMLQPPFFHGHYPRSYNYGSIGVLMARAMVKAVDEIGVHYSPDGTLDPPSNSTILSNHLQEPRTCLKAALKELEAGADEEIERGANCSTNDAAGLRLALQGLSASLEELEELPQPGLSFEPEGIFFSSYSQMFCGQSKKQQEEMDFIVSRCFPAKTRLRASLNQLDEFGDAFECNGADWSSSSKKCGRII